MSHKVLPRIKRKLRHFANAFRKPKGVGAVRSLQNQVEGLTRALLNPSNAFDDETYRRRNTMFDHGYGERNERSERYRSQNLGPRAERYSCVHLEQFVNLDLDGLALCCHPHSGNRGCVRVGKFQGDSFPLGLLLSARAKIRDDLNDGIDTPCTGCDMLRKQVWKKAIYPVNGVTINDWTECNLRCEYCYTLNENSSRLIGEKRKHNLYPLMKDMLEQGYLAPDSVVGWGGGEVTIYQAFEPTAALLADNRIQQHVNTNAVLHSAAIERGLRAGNMIVRVSVDAGTRETYQRIKGRDAFDAVWKTIGKYAAAGMLTAKYIVYDRNSAREDLQGFLRLCIANDVDSITVVPETGRNITGDFSGETRRNTAAMIDEARKRGLSVTATPFTP